MNRVDRFGRGEFVRMNSRHEVCTRLLTLGSTALICGFAACLPSEYEVEVLLSYPDGRPIPGAEITAIPFDRDALRDTVANRSEIPRPAFSDLESDLAGYQRPDLTGLDEAFEPWRAIYDSVQHLADSLNSVESRSTAGYAGAYARLRDQYQRLARSTAQRDAALREHIGDDWDLAMRTAAAADSLRAWEGRALASYTEVVDSVLHGSGRGIFRGLTGVDGTAEFTLAPGRWWFVARTDDADNPFMEVYWNVGVTVRLISSKRIRLNDGNGVRRWRY